MRDHVLLYLNGERRRVDGTAAFRTLTEHLRDDLRLQGTKVVCAEGDCGACSVLVGRPANGRLEYRAVDACITFVHQLDAAHVVTVEGLARDGRLHPVQQAMIDGYGSQCGFCTPGIVTTLASLFEQHRGAAGAPSWEESKQALTGNLCRCTGYWQILESATAVDATAVPPLAELYPERDLLDELSRAARDAVRVEAGPRVVFLPADLDAACRFKADHPGCLVVAGATDVAVKRNKTGVEADSVLALGARLPGFADASIEGGVLRAGAGATWASLLDLTRERVPELAPILERFGAPQIRNAATIGGNLANASPIADSLPFLYVAGATLELRAPGRTRRVPIEAFYRGYKEIDLAPDELIGAVEVPLPRRGEDLRLYKMSRRRALDIASFTAAVLMRRHGGVIAEARVAYGGVGPTVLRVPRAERSLVGQPFALDALRRAGEIAAAEITPWTDVRGSERYRRRLAENTLSKFFYDVTEPAPGDLDRLLGSAPSGSRTAAGAR